jgi:hypothetical protein
MGKRRESRPGGYCLLYYPQLVAIDQDSIRGVVQPAGFFVLTEAPLTHV